MASKRKTSKFLGVESGSTFRPPSILHFGHRASIMSVGLWLPLDDGVGKLDVARTSAALPAASIMVLLLQNSSGDPGQDYIADAVTDDLTTDLSFLPTPWRVPTFHAAFQHIAVN